MKTTGGKVARAALWARVLWGAFVLLLCDALFMLLNLAGLFSFVTAFFVLMLAAVFGFPLLIAATLFVRRWCRDDPQALGSLPPTRWQYLAFLGVLLIAAAFPISPRTQAIAREKECEDDLARLGLAVERYAAEKGSLPDSLEPFLQGNGVGYISGIGRVDWLYRKPAAGGGGFELACPDPGKMKKARGFLPARRCREIRYVQGRGVVVETE